MSARGDSLLAQALAWLERNPGESITVDDAVLEFGCAKQTAMNVLYRAVREKQLGVMPKKIRDPARYCLPERSSPAALAKDDAKFYPKGWPWKAPKAKAA